MKRFTLKVVKEAPQRLMIKRALRRAGVPIPEKINFNLAALRRLHAATIGKGGPQS